MGLTPEERNTKKQSATKEMHMGIFYPPDASKATPYNCWLLRFPEFAPQFPFRQYMHMSAFKAAITASPPLVILISRLIYMNSII
jgi:hypothetical protein